MPCRHPPASGLPTHRPSAEGIASVVLPVRHIRRERTTAARHRRQRSGFRRAEAGAARRGRPEGRPRTQAGPDARPADTRPRARDGRTGRRGRAAHVDVAHELTAKLFQHGAHVALHETGVVGDPVEAHGLVALMELQASPTSRPHRTRSRTRAARRPRPAPLGPTPHPTRPSLTAKSRGARRRALHRAGRHRRLPHPNEER